MKRHYVFITLLFAVFMFPFVENVSTADAQNYAKKQMEAEYLAACLSEKELHVDDRDCCFAYESGEIEGWRQRFEQKTEMRRMWMGKAERDRQKIMRGRQKTKPQGNPNWPGRSEIIEGVTVTTNPSWYSIDPCPCIGRRLSHRECYQDKSSMR